MDFTPLTDDQLLELIRAACCEAAARGTACAAAMHEIVIDQAEQARISREAAAKVDETAVMAEKIRLFRLAAQ